MEITEIITALLTGGLALVGVIITNMQSNKKIENQLDKQQAVMDVKIETLTTEVRQHNNFAVRIPVIEEQIKVVNHRLNDLERGKNEQ